VDLQVISFHRFALGTFHSKFMIVDRQMACVASNNIEVCIDLVARRIAIIVSRITIIQR